MGMHVCPNTENVGPNMIHVTETGNRNTELSGIPQPLSAESDVELLQEMLMSHYRLRDQSIPREPALTSASLEIPLCLPTYREAIAYRQNLIPRSDVPFEAQNIL